MKTLSLVSLLILGCCLYGCKTVEEEKEAAPAEQAKQVEQVEQVENAAEQKSAPSVRHENGQLVIDMVEVK